jgi:hypothetical protein
MAWHGVVKLWYQKDVVVSDSQSGAEARCSRFLNPMTGVSSPPPPITISSLRLYKPLELSFAAGVFHPFMVVILWINAARSVSAFLPETSRRRLHDIAWTSTSNIGSLKDAIKTNDR